MIKKIFKWLYLLLSGVSFLLVIALVAFFSYIAYNDAEVQQYFEDFNDFRVHKEEQADEELFTISAREEEDTVESFAQKTADLSICTEYSSSNLKKIRFTTSKGYCFLRSSQIVSIQSGKPNYLITTTKGDKLDLPHRKYSLTNLEDTLNSKDGFFKMKQFIINGYYIDRIEDTQGVKQVYMDNGYKFNLPDEQLNPLLTHLENLAE